MEGRNRNAVQSDSLQRELAWRSACDAAGCPASLPAAQVCAAVKQQGEQHHEGAHADATGDQLARLENANRVADVPQLRQDMAGDQHRLAHVRELAEKLRGMGRRVQYEEIAGGDHDSPVRGVDWAAVLDFVSAAP